MASSSILKPKTSQTNSSTLWTYLCHYALSDYQDITNKRSAPLDLLPVPAKTEKKKRDNGDEYFKEMMMKPFKKRILEILTKKPNNKRPSCPKKPAANKKPKKPTERLPEPPMRVEFQRAIQKLGGKDIKWLNSKKIENSDVGRQQGRLYLPKFMDEYLYENEIKHLQAKTGKEIWVSVIDDINYKVHEIALRYWPTIERFILVTGWMDFVSAMGIKKTNDQKAEIWTFRIPQEPDKDGKDRPKKLGLVINITGRDMEDLNEVCYQGEEDPDYET